MYNRIVKSSVSCKTVYNAVKTSTSTTEQTVKTTIIATKTTNDTLQLPTIKSSNTTLSIQVMFKSLRWGAIKRIKVFSMTICIHVDCDPVFSRLCRNVGVGH